MGNSQRLGCFGFLALIFLIAVVWQAILYIGIPIAIVGGLVAAYLFKVGKEDAANDHSRRNAAILVAGGSGVLFLASLAGNIFTDDGPFRRAPQANGEDSDQEFSLEVRRRSACLDSVLGPTDDQYGVGLIANGSPVDETVEENSDGTATVTVIRERVNAAGSCPVKLVASCQVSGDKVISHTDLREDGYVAC